MSGQVKGASQVWERCPRQWDTGKAAGFPGESMVKNPPANATEMDSIPGPKRSHVPLGD